MFWGYRTCIFLLESNLGTARTSPFGLELATRVQAKGEVLNRPLIRLQEKYAGSITSKHIRVLAFWYYTEMSVVWGVWRELTEVFEQVNWRRNDWCIRINDLINSFALHFDPGWTRTRTPGDVLTQCPDDSTLWATHDPPPTCAN